MKKASKILTLILVFVLLAGIFSGCAMFTRNAGRYRSLVAVTVGNEEITVGKILDTFNNYYSTYGSYIGQGITAEYLLQMSMQSLVTQAMKVDAYVSTAAEPADNTALKDICHNAQYLTKEEIEFCVTYVKYLTFQTFDSSVLSQLSANRTFADEETEDTSRDFTELDNLEGRDYSEYTYRNRVFSDDAKEYFDKYYQGIEIKLDNGVSEYVYTTEAAAKAKLDSLNNRKDDKDEVVTYDEYKTAQEKVVNQYQRTVKNSYGIEFDQFMINQIADMVNSVIVAKYDYSINRTIDTDEGLTATINQLKSNLAINRDSQIAGFALNNNFVDFIEGLSSSSYIYNVPEAYERVNTPEKQSGYIFVKNILVPFTEQQKTTLANLAKDLGGDTTKQEYIDKRNQFAAEVIADDFNSEKDEDGKYKPVSGIFAKNDAGELIINPEGELGKEFVNGKVVAPEGKTADQVVIEYMKRFNTDTAQHTAQYDYVVRVGEVPSDYTAKWVTEFVDAANEAAKGGVGSYALAISTYGVHIVYYSADVVAQDINFTAESILDTATPEYRLFSAYFSQQSSRLINEQVEALQKAYLDEGKIKTNKNFDKFLKNNDFKFDLIKFLTEED